MRQKFKRFVAACIVSLVSGPVASSHTTDGEDSNLISECPRHLHALISYHQETANLEGRSLEVNWKSNGEAILYHDTYTQHIWCQNEELHIDFGDATRR